MSPINQLIKWLREIQSPEVDSGQFVGLVPAKRLHAITVAAYAGPHGWEEDEFAGVGTQCR
jgi:hypothetical protein